MGQVIASCGHDITGEKEVCLSIMDFTRECENAVTYGVFCKSCRDQYEKWGLVLHNEEEEKKWLRGEMEYPG